MQTLATADRDDVRTVAGEVPLLLVAGPSGAGKSTFIELMRQGRLPEDISAELPRGCEHWPVWAANDVRKYGIDPDSMLSGAARDKGVVLHYDFVFPHRYGIHAYENDPAAALFTRSGAPVIVSVKLSRDRLLGQFESRLQRHMSSKSMPRRLWRHHVHRPMRRVMARFRGGTPRETADLYSDPAWLARCCEQWDAYVRSIVRHMPGAKVLAVTPSQMTGQGPAFRLLGGPDAIAT